MILAGGRSQRMGRPKAWLDLDGAPMLVRVCDTVAAAVASVVVVGTSGDALPELPAGIVRVDDPQARRHGGPLAGVVTGLEAIEREGPAAVYVGAVDAAWLTTRHVQWMLDALLAAPDCDAIVPETIASDATRVVCATSGALRSTAALAVARARITAGRGALRGLYDALGARRVDVADLPDPQVVRPCNTLDDWRAACAGRTRT